MPFVPDEDSANALFATHVWLDDNDEKGVASSFSTMEEAQNDFDRLEAGRSYGYGGLYRWNHARANWDCIDAFPEDFDGAV